MPELACVAPSALMQTVSCRVTAVILDAVSQEIGAQDLGRDLPVPLAQLSNKTGRVHWETLAIFLGNLRDRYPRREDLETLGMALYDQASWTFAVRAVQFVASPRGALRMVEKWIHALLPAVEVELIHRDRNTSSLSLKIPDHLRESEEYLAICAGQFRRLPSLLGYADCTVTASYDHRCGVFGFHFESEISAPRRAQQFVRGFTRLPGKLYSLLELNREREALRRARRRWRADFDHLVRVLPDGILLHRGREILFVNAALTGALGYPSRETLAIAALEPLLELTTPTPTTDARRRIDLRHRDGRRVPVEIVRVRPIALAEGEAEVVIVRDVTERDLVRERLRFTDRMGSLGLLAASLAHEINNPLAYAYGSAQLLGRRIERFEAGQVLSGDDLRELREITNTSLEGLERVRGLVSGLRVFTRRDEEQPRAVDAVRCVQYAIGLAEREISDRTALSFIHGPVPAVVATTTGLSQIVLNLLMNAFQAFEQDHRSGNRIDIRIVPRGTDGVRITVADNGPGMGADVARQALEPFFTTKAAGVGTGLGLSICQDLVERYGGRLGIDSELGRGTTVCIDLIAADPRRDEAADPADPAGAAGSDSELP